MEKKPKSAVRTSLVVSACSLGIALFTPFQASAQEITLRSTTSSSINISGDLISFEDDVYTIDTSLGTVSLRAAGLECIGEACPVIQASIVTGPVVWDVSLWGNRRAFTEHVEKLAELVDEKTGGQLTLNLSYGGLAPSRENLDGIAAGDFEMAQFCAGYHPDKNPSITVLELPFLGVSTLREELAVSRAVYEHPAVIADLARWNATLLMPTPQPQYNIIGVGSPPTTIEAFEKMTIRATGGTGAAVQALGAASVNLPAPQVNAALTNGEINAVAFAPHAHMAFKTVDNAVWWTSNLNPGTANCPIVVSKRALDTLPASSRIALLSSVDEALEHFIDNYNSSTMAAWDTALLDKQIIELTFSDEMISAISNEVAGPSTSKWIAEKSALGLPARELYEIIPRTLRAMR
ncbi:C4-dicarboxylate ABC transporter substrate-binding protein [Jannaschia pohangensis]|uniref:TRAP-type C4-dicarboxylate transport system, substrate-binding protein n=1 Tax=Jannaschia pohangensis TaxID=390807 RepID=A0A1I3MR99_9RHOB|nr:C4-dicarboxylate ABC transporter substrate-binding protein [Jannaschia pohangensis]SFI99654.1 TRAP-type C4-dicarboxylate transport system, substrate-binding protein [Jannaschia pohangensis]